MGQHTEAVEHIKCIGPRDPGRIFLGCPKN
jgi:hypothetical protein